MKVTQLCPTLCDPMDYTTHGIPQARILEGIAVLFSGDLPNPGIEARSPALQENYLPGATGRDSCLYVSLAIPKSGTMC